jgi:hypothetical protein
MTQQGGPGEGAGDADEAELDVMRAVLDETYPEHGGGILYVVAATIVLSDGPSTKAAIDRVLTTPGRSRPFHWADEGPQARQNMLICLEEVGAVAHVCVHSPTGRKKTEQARAKSLRRVLPILLEEGVSDLIIESRTAIDDDRDKRVILDVLKDLGKAGQLTYDWHTKNDPTLWLADAVCGAVREYLLSQDTTYYTQLKAAGVLAEPMYINETNP